MKFGKYIKLQSKPGLPYIDYKLLKQLLKPIKEKKKQITSKYENDFRNCLIEQIIRVEQFFLNQLNKSIKYSKEISNNNLVEGEVRVHALAMQELMDYLQLNKAAVLKILKKHDKIINHNTQKQFITEHIKGVYKWWDGSDEVANHLATIYLILKHRTSLSMNTVAQNNNNSNNNSRQNQRYAANGIRLTAGVIPFRLYNSTIQILLVKSQGRGEWIFPKGGWEKNESIEECAKREAYEESGVAGIIAGSLGTVHSLSGKKKATMLHMFLYDVKTELQEYPEKSWRTRMWVDLKDVLKYITRPIMCEFYQRALRHPTLAFINNIIDSDSQQQQQQQQQYQQQFQQQQQYQQQLQQQRYQNESKY